MIHPAWFPSFIELFFHSYGILMNAIGFSHVALLSEINGKRASQLLAGCFSPMGYLMQGLQESRPKAISVCLYMASVK